jgi:hypothetical protein
LDISGAFRLPALKRYLECGGKSIQTTSIVLLAIREFHWAAPANSPSANQLRSTHTFSVDYSINHGCKHGFLAGLRHSLTAFPLQ